MSLVPRILGIGDFKYKESGTQVSARTYGFVPTFERRYGERGAGIVGKTIEVFFCEGCAAAQNVRVWEYLTMSARERDSGSAGRSNRDGARSVSSPSL
jgi:hypothetical protein